MYDEYIGDKFSVAEEDLAYRGMMLRRYNPNTLITADYRDNRLNVQTDENDIITKIIGLG